MHAHKHSYNHEFFLSFSHSFAPSFFPVDSILRARAVALSLLLFLLALSFSFLFFLSLALTCFSSTRRPPIFLSSVSLFCSLLLSQFCCRICCPSCCLSRCLSRCLSHARSLARARACTLLACTLSISMWCEELFTYSHTCLSLASKSALFYLLFRSLFRPCSFSLVSTQYFSPFLSPSGSRTPTCTSSL